MSIWIQAVVEVALQQAHVQVASCKTVQLNQNPARLYNVNMEIFEMNMLVNYPPPDRQESTAQQQPAQRRWAGLLAAEAEVPRCL